MKVEIQILLDYDLGYQEHSKYPRYTVYTVHYYLCDLPYPVLNVLVKASQFTLPLRYNENLDICKMQIF